MTTQNLLRLALRVEGDWWVAYCAEATTMDGAVELGRIHMTLVQKRRPKTAWMDLMRDCLADLIGSGLGVTPSGFEIRPAPEHERAGRA
jgi:hypothetical protein